MAKKNTYKLKGVAHPTHILVPDDDTKDECVMYACDDGAFIFLEGEHPQRNLSYKLVPNIEYEEYQQKIKRT